VVRLLIVDDHGVVRQGLKQFLAAMPDIVVGGEAASAQEALAALRGGSWDLLLLDIAMPDGNGLDLLKQIKRERPELPVLIFSMFSEHEYAIRALRNGASGYLTKDSPPERLLEAIRRVTRGGRYVGEDLAERLLLDPTLEQPPKQLHGKLSARELDVLRHISRGEPLTRIGERLHLSVKTVSTYRRRILEKLGVSSNAELIRYVLEHHLDL
jgi:DNA-binding NarL/FixJ family response regulator